MAAAPAPSEAFQAATTRTEGNLHVLIIATGSVASIKIPLIVEALTKNKGISVQIVATEPSLTFFDPAAVASASSGKVRVWRDEDEWKSWNKIGDPILHIELRRWADLVLVAPCSANTLAKIAGGICDNLGTSLLRALDASTPTWLFPAMNTHMYAHPLTARHLSFVQEVLGYQVEGPIGKGLACGDVGMGAMTEWSDIVKLVENHYDEVSSSISLSVLSLSPGTPASPSPSIITKPLDPSQIIAQPAIITSYNPRPPQPPAPPAFEPFIDSRHPLILPQASIEKLIAQHVLPPSLVHRSAEEGSNGRIFWFVPSRLRDEQLDALSEAVRTEEGKRGGSEEVKEEVRETEEWLLQRRTSDA